MADWGSEFSFLESINVRIDIGIDISISIRPMAAKFGKQRHLEEWNQMRRQTKKKYLHYQSDFGLQTWQDGNLPWWAPVHKVIWHFDLKVLRDHVTH